MAERRKAPSRTRGRTSTRSREPSDQDEREMLGAEPEDLEEDEFVDDGEAEEVDDEMPDAGEPARRSRPGMTAGQAAKAALREIAALTAKQPEGITQVERTEDGWTVGVELVEDQRIPSSADILATYEVTIDADGELESYRRVRRYTRGRGDSEEM